MQLSVFKKEMRALSSKLDVVLLWLRAYTSLPSLFLSRPDSCICKSDHPHLIDALQPVIKNMSGRKADTCCSRGRASNCRTACTLCRRCRHTRLRPPLTSPPRKPTSEDKS